MTLFASSSALVTASATYKYFFDHLPAAALLLRHGRIVELNAAAAAAFHASRTELLQRPLRELLPDAAGPLSQLLSETDAEAGTAVPASAQPLRFTRPDGSRFSATWQASVCPATEGTCYCLLLFPQPAATAQEPAPAVPFSPRVDLPSTLCAFTLNATGQVTQVSEALLRLVGLPQEALLQREDFQRLAAQLRQQLQLPANSDGEANLKLEFPLQASNGRTLDLRWDHLLLLDDNGKPAALVCFAFNQTELHQHIEKLQARKRQLQDLIENAHDFIQQTDLEGRFVFVNKAWLRHMGYTKSEATTLRLSDVVHPDFRQQLEDQRLALLEGRQIEDIDTVFLTKDGQPINLHGSVTVHYSNGIPSGTRAILHDMTDRIKADQIQKVYYRIANLAISTFDLPELYQGIHLELSRLLDTSNIYIALCDEHHRKLEFVYLVDENRSQNNLLPKRNFESGLTEYIIRTGEPLFAHREDLEVLAANSQVEPKGKLPEVFIGTPLRLEGQIRGVLALQNYHNPRAFRDSDLRLLHFISNQIALAIERKRYEEQINNQTARLRSIFESSSHLIWSVDRQVRLTSFNQNYARAIYAQYGVMPTVNTDPDQPKQQFANSDYHRFWDEKYRLVFMGIPQQFTTCLTDLEGRQVWRQIYLNPIYLEDGSFEEVAGIAHDITEMKQAEQAIQKSEEEFRNIFESFQDVYYRTDLEGYMQLISPSVKDLLGYTPEEATGMHASVYYMSLRDREKLLREVFEHGRVRNFETTLKRKDGSKVQVILNSHLLSDKEGKPIGLEGVIKDITDLKKTQQALIQAKEDAENSLKVKAQFLANMSHELRTPMNGIIGMIDLLSQTNPTEEQRDFLDTLRRSSEALLHILNDILDLSKIQAGKLQLHESQLDLNYVLEKIYSLFLNRAYQKNLNLTYQIKEGTPRYIFTDETRLLQILSNLTSNAIKFTNSGEISIRVSPKQVNGQEYTLLFEVADTGIGIPEMQKSLLFTNFTQLDNSSTKSFSGTGLGLAISKQLCELLGGDIGVESKEHEGSTFWFTIRCLAATEPDKMARNAASADDEKKTPLLPSHPRVLLVDDNQINQKVAEKLLEKIGCEVSVASNGYQAIDLALTRQFDYIFMDIQMPEMDGITATRHIKRLLAKKCPPVVAMTAYSMKHDAEKFIEEGLDDYIAKPVKAIDLYNMIHKWSTSPDPEPTPGQPAATPAQAPAPAPEPAVDKEILEQLRLLGGDEFARQLYDDFAREGQELLSTIQKEGLQQKNEQILAKLHQLKGTAGTLGVQQVAALAKKVEEALRQSKLENAPSDLQELYRHFDHFLVTYHTFF